MIKIAIIGFGVVGSGVVGSGVVGVGVGVVGVGATVVVVVSPPPHPAKTRAATPKIRPKTLFFIFFYFSLFLF